jgi:formamidopyrimidine-DNA glycosylase
VPELPEVESARRVIEQRALGREITDVDDHDTYECRPHRPGDLRTALLGRTLTAVHRRGKSMWCETSGVDGSPEAGPALGIHLGMSGTVVVVDRDGTETDGGDYWQRGREPGDERFTRFSLTFADGGRLLLLDPRRLGRVRLDPEVHLLGPDAATITLREFRSAVARGTAPVKARLLDQTALAGVGNLLADQALWQARLDPRRHVGELGDDEVRRLHRAVRSAVQSASRDGGVHTLRILPYRAAGARCPRDGAPMMRGSVGGRTTWWCSLEQGGDSLA